MEEERRLCYVGMTRAKRELYLTYASSRMLYGGVQHNPPSRFLSDIEAEFEVDQYSAAGAWSSQQPAVPNPSAFKDNEPRYQIELVEGDSVRHKVFGDGTVMEIEGDSAVVYFKNRGAKKLNMAFAPLEKL
jgi:DNA helicase-2/ATP-dependent DNA helicase PcrA